MKAIKNYFKDAYYELHHVTWPTQNQLVRLTIITIVFVALTAAFIGIFDYLFSIAYTYLLNLQ